MKLLFRSVARRHSPYNDLLLCYNPMQKYLSVNSVAAVMIRIHGLCFVDLGFCSLTTRYLIEVPVQWLPKLGYLFVPDGTVA